MAALILPLLQGWISETEKTEIQNDPKAFIRSLEGKLLNDNRNVTASDYFLLGCAHLQNEDSKRAEQSFRLALQKNLVHLPSLFALSLQILLKNPRSSEGRNILKRAFRLDPAAEESALKFQRTLKNQLGAKLNYEELSKLQVWCLEEVLRLDKAGEEVEFQLGKILFEQSQLNESIPHLRKALNSESLRAEATEYLSYIYEHLYQGDELVERTLELAEEVNCRVDLFFNLAMVCQHEEKRPELAMHFFYLASLEDPNDPGLRFSLEQSSLEFIGKTQKRGGSSGSSRRSDLKKQTEADFLLMMAHLYQGSVGVAKKYADQIKSATEGGFWVSLTERMPQKLWQNWLLKTSGPVERYLKEWFLETGSDNNNIIYLPNTQSVR